MDVWLYLVIVGLIAGALDLITTAGGFGLRKALKRYGYLPGPLVELNPFLKKAMDSGRASYLIAGLVVVAEQKVIYILGAHMLILYVSEYACPVLCFFVGCNMFFAFNNTLVIIDMVWHARKDKELMKDWENYFAKQCNLVSVGEGKDAIIGTGEVVDADRL